jgi:hypothetical protein
MPTGNIVPDPLLVPWLGSLLTARVHVNKTEVQGYASHALKDSESGCVFRVFCQMKLGKKFGEPGRTRTSNPLIFADRL